MFYRLKEISLIRFIGNLIFVLPSGLHKSSKMLRYIIVFYGNKFFSAFLFSFFFPLERFRAVLNQPNGLMLRLSMGKKGFYVLVCVLILMWTQ